MSVKLRLRRLGRKKLPVFAVVAADSRSARDGRFIEDLGRYQPLREPSTVELKEDRVLYWLSQGARPSDTVRNLLNREGVLLAHSMRLKGVSNEEIQEAVAKHRAYRYEKLGADVKETPAARRRRALKEESERVAKEEEEAAKLQAEADAKAKQEAEAAKKKAAEQRAAAAAEARRAQEEANVAEGESEASTEEAVKPVAADAGDEAEASTEATAEAEEGTTESQADASSETAQNAEETDDTSETETVDADAGAAEADKTAEAGEAADAEEDVGENEAAAAAEAASDAGETEESESTSDAEADDAKEQ